MLGFQPYIDYIMLKRHFSEGDFLWSEEAVYRKFKPSTFQSRKDSAFFCKLESMSNKDRKIWVDKLVSGFTFFHNFWIGDIFNDEYIDYHQERIKRYSALERTFEVDMEALVNQSSGNFNMESYLLTSGPKDPIIMNWFLRPISIESFAVLEFLTEFTRLWFPLNPLQKLRRNLIYKYSKVLRLEGRDVSRIKNTYHKIVQS